MRCGSLSSAALAVSLLLPVTGRLLGNLHRAQRQGGTGCPNECACQSGTPSNGGVVIPNGLCYDFCSAPHGQIQYCGRGSNYQQGASTDCRACKDATYFDATYTLHQPASKAATESIILLGPFNASAGWGMNWIFKSSGQSNPHILQQSRVLDVVGKPAWWEGYGKVTAWYGYPGYDDWLKNVPVAPEVDHAVAYVHHLIEQEYRIVGDYRRIVLVGLHQGGNIALESALRFPHALGLVISQRGIVLPARAQSTKPVAATPYVLTAGGKDDVYPASQIRANAHSLQTMHATVFMKTLPEFDHFKWSMQESNLVLKSLSAALTEAPVSTSTLAALTDWTVAS